MSQWNELSFKKGNLVDEDFPKLGAEVVEGEGNTTLAPPGRPGTPWAQGSEWWIQEQCKQRERKEGLMRVRLLINWYKAT